MYTVVQFCINAGADLQHKDNQGKTALLSTIKSLNIICVCFEYLTIIHML